VDLRSDLVTTLVFGRAPDRVAQLLADSSTRTVALLFARLAATEEVLAALLDMPVPGDGDVRELYVQALAEMGDPAALAALDPIRQTDGSAAVRDAWATANAILGKA
jgi:HEAT repeat protein